MSITFTISNPWTVLHQVNITSNKSELAEITSISGSFRNTEYNSFNGLVFGEINRLESITVDGEKNIEGDEAHVQAVFMKIQEAINQQIGNATLMGRNLVIKTNL